MRLQFIMMCILIVVAGFTNACKYQMYIILLLHEYVYLTMFYLYNHQINKLI